MKTVIIVSKCSRVTNFGPSEKLYEFHFKGVCAGENIKRVILEGRIDFNIKRHEEYLIYAQMIAFDKGILRGKILKCKLLSDCWDKSSQR